MRNAENLPIHWPAAGTRAAWAISGELYSFAESSGGRLACVRGTTTWGVVPIEDFY
jgi:hypothetical protein